MLRVSKLLIVKCQIFIIERNIADIENIPTRVTLTVENKTKILRLQLIED